MSLVLGQKIVFERTFVAADVTQFTAVSQDEGVHHVTPDEHGRLVVHGLLTATLPTKVGGAHDVLARTMLFEFVRPVYSGDTIRCEVEIVELGQDEKQRTQLKATFVCQNQHEKTVLSGYFEGVIL
ncbi:MAG: hypothetical protein KBC57_05195 [Neisseriaceae bacterium]|nr:hypothetical protein [Neisseriaceae bacterium]MBP6861735.1 hypothetical protein [Neisseriaceae bacterium]